MSNIPANKKVVRVASSALALGLTVAVVQPALATTYSPKNLSVADVTKADQFGITSAEQIALGNHDHDHDHDQQQVAAAVISSKIFNV